MIRLLFLFILSSAFNISAQAEILKSDELVQNLSCERLSAETIYKSIRPSAFDPTRRQTIPNFSRHMIGYCWSLSRFQRMTLLLGRTFEPLLEYNPAQIQTLIRGGTYERLVGLSKTNVSYLKPLTNYSVFKLPHATSPTRQTKEKYEKIDRDLGGQLIHEIIKKQFRLFYRPNNLKFVFAPLPVAQQARELMRIYRLANQNRLPMINIKRAAMQQHIVIVKSAKKLGSNHIELTTIDPDDPLIDTRYEFKIENAQFVISRKSKHGYFDSNWTAEAIYLVTDSERSMIDQALLSYYSRLCQK